MNLRIARATSEGKEPAKVPMPIVYRAFAETPAAGKAEWYRKVTTIFDKIENEMQLYSTNDRDNSEERARVERCLRALRTVRQQVEEDFGK